VEVIGAAVDQLFDELGKLGASSPFCGEVADLLFGWNLTGEEEPEKTLREWLFAAWGFGKEFLAFWDLFRSVFELSERQWRSLRFCRGIECLLRNRGRIPR
jgi:hypothetical protein